MTWHAELHLDYTARNGKTVVYHTHKGPLRVLQSLYPEGDAICHNVLVHPPGGLVGGDTLDVSVALHANAQALITTPGATRFYRSDGPLARQHTRIALHDESRLQWLPLETICYDACRGENRLEATLAPGAEMLGWDITALGLPLAHLPFTQGEMLQHLEVPGVWLERGCIRGDDTRLLNSPTGMAGHRCMGVAFFVSGRPMDRTRRQQALDCARAAYDQHGLRAWTGATSPHPQVVVVRTLAPVVEPAVEVLRAVRAAWLKELWGQQPTLPRIWSM